jgi:hypothetical protein
MWVEKPFASCWKATTSSRGGKKMWCVGKLDQEYIAKVEDVLKVYEKPLLASEPVVCVDEKPVVLHKDTQPAMPMRPGKVARRDYQYKRCGTANVFCGVEPKAGVHFTKATTTRSSPEFADFILDIAAHYPIADTIHLVFDNLSTQTRKALTDRFGEQDGSWLWNRFTVHYTPTHGSWLNQAEVEISLFSRQCLARRRLGDIDQLRREVKAWNRRSNRDRITSGSSPEKRHAEHFITQPCGHSTSVCRMLTPRGMR